MLRKTILISFAALLLNACVSFPSGDPFKRDLDSETHERIRALTKKMSRILYLIQKNSLKNIDIEKCFDQIIDGGLEKCQDVYAAYSDLDELELMESVRVDENIGIGISVVEVDFGFKIIELAPGLPAERAGLATEDVIVSVNGSPMTDKPLMHFINKMDGEEETAVTLEVLRRNAKLEFSIKRTKFIVPVIHYKQFGDIGYFKLVEFTPTIYRDLPPILSGLDKSSAVILDLRNNPGGYVNWTNFIAKLFTRQGDLILTFWGRDEESVIQIRAEEDGYLAGKPLVILINHDSKSSSEIVAGALKELGRAVIIGEKSYGKGVAQTTFPLKDGTDLKLTTHEFFVGPKEKAVHGIGVIPDIEIRQPIPENQERRFSYKIDPAADPQLKKALEFLGYDESNTSSP